MTPLRGDIITCSPLSSKISQFPAHRTLALSIPLSVEPLLRIAENLQQYLSNLSCCSKLGCFRQEEIMAPRRRSSVVKPTQVAHSTIDAARAASKTEESQLRRVPSPVRFVLVVFNSLLLSSVLFTMTSSVTLGELGRVSKHLEAWWEVGGLMLWKAVEVGLAWILGFDGELYPTSIAMLL
jgi:hypothetical protein